jgi:hypothetical protein
VRHESVFFAKTREEVFVALRSKGIKPIKVWPIYSRFHVPKSIMLIGILVVALGASLYYSFLKTENKQKNNINISPRHQIYGDPARMEEMESSGYQNILSTPGDRFLAAYAIPGKPISNEGLISPKKAKEILKLGKANYSLTFDKDLIIDYIKTDKKGKGDSVDFIVINNDLHAEIKNIKLEELFKVI